MLISCVNCVIYLSSLPYFLHLISVSSSKYKQVVSEQRLVFGLWKEEEELHR
jgi:hypothetical protein